MSTHSASPRTPQRTGTHSFDSGNSGWQVWNSGSLKPVASSPPSPSRPRSSSHPPNTPRPWTDPDPTNSQQILGSGHAFQPPSSALPETNSSFGSGQKRIQPSFEVSHSFVASRDAGPMRHAPFPTTYASASFAEEQPYGIPPVHRQVIPHAMPYSIPAPDYPMPYYLNRASNEIPYPMAPEASYFSSQILPPAPPLYSSIPHAVPVHQITQEVPTPRPGFVYEYNPPQGIPFVYPTPPFLPSSPGQQSPLPQGVSHFPLASDFPKYPSPQVPHSPQSPSAPNSLVSRQFRPRSSTQNSSHGHSDLTPSRFIRREAVSRIPRSPQGPKNTLLEQFRSNRDRKWEFADIRGSLAEFAGDQYGSRFIQEKLPTLGYEGIQCLFEELVPSRALALMADVFGNYVVQKMFDHGVAVQRSLLVQVMGGRILDLSLHMYGCRVVQKAIETISPDEQSLFIAELGPHILQCVKDANGNHVVQKLVQCVSADRLTFLETFRTHIRELASHPYGCRVLQRCLEHLPQTHTTLLVQALQGFADGLVQNQFGNYVMQYVLEHGRPDERAGVIAAMKPTFVHLSKHKYASNVCEKALLCASLEDRRGLIRTLLGSGDEERAIGSLMRDQYANYVLQKALQVAEGEQKDRLYTVARAVSLSVKQSASGNNKNLLAIEKILDKYPPMGTTSAI